MKKKRKEKKKRERSNAAERYVKRGEKKRGDLHAGGL